VAGNRGELSVEELRWTLDPESLGFTSTEELNALDGVIGQDRAVRAVSFGVDIEGPGYHVFALGPSGTGKATMVRKFLERQAPDRPVPDDWLYVNNFEDADKPIALRMPAGRGCAFRQDMDRVVDELNTEIPRTFESDEYEREQQQIQEDLQKQRQALFEELEQEAQSRGFIDIGGTTIELMQGPAGDMERPSRGFMHLAFEVDDVDATYADLLMKGVEFFVEPKNVGDIRLAFFRDPDGNELELFQSPTLTWKRR